MRLLIICSGNTCRSPLAAALLKHKARHNNLLLEVRSAGTAASAGHPMSLPMEIILQERGIDSTHQSQRVSWNLVNWADLILTMTRAHKAILMAAVPQIFPKVFTLNEYIGANSSLDIDDPYSTHLDSYRRCASEIEQGCDRMLSKLRKIIEKPSIP